MIKRASGSGRDCRPIIGVFILVAALLGAAAPAQAEGTPNFSKSFNPSTIGPGSSTTLTFTIGNSTGELVTDLAFSDTLPSGLVIATPSGAKTNCADGVLVAPAGGSVISLSGAKAGLWVTCTASVNVTSSVPGVLINTSGDLTSSAGNSGSASAELAVDAAVPGVSKSFSPSSIPLGATSRLTIFFDNQANPNPVETFMSLQDTLPPGLVIATPSNVITDCGSPELTAVVTATPGSSSVSIFLNAFTGFPSIDENSSCSVGLDVRAANLGIFNNVSGNLETDAGQVGFATASLEVEVKFLTKLFLNDPVVPGGTVDLQFNIQNPSRTEAATGISFTDGLPAGLSLSSAPVPDPPCGAGSSLTGTTTLSLAGGTLPAEGSCAFTVTLDVPGAATTGDYTNTTSAITATIGGELEVGEAASDVLTIKYLPVLAKQFQTNPVGAGGTTDLRFTITNTHPTLSLTDISFVDIFEDVLPTASVVPSNPVCNGGTATYSPQFNGAGSNSPAQLSLTGASLAGGTSCTIDITLDVLSGAPEGIYPNVTSVISGTLDGAPAEGLPARDDLAVEGGPTLLKEFTNDPALPDGTVDLKFTLSHSEFASADATSIAFTDDLAATLSGLVATGLPIPACGGTVSSPDGGATLEFSGGSLAPGAECDFTVTLAVPAAPSPGAHLNTTSLVTATVGGLAVTANPASDDLRIVGLTLAKEFTDDAVLPGDPVTLRFTLTNDHPTLDATGIQFTDDLDDALAGLVATAPLPIAPCGGSLSGTNELIFTGGSVNAGLSCNFEVTLTVPATAPEGTHINVTSAVSSSQGTSNQASDGLIVELPLAPVLTKEFTDDPVEVGLETTLKFTLTNPNDVEALDDIAFGDDLAATLAGLEASGATANTCGGMAGTPFPTSLFVYTAPTLAAGAACEIELTVAVPGTANPGSYLNTTTAPTADFNGGVAGPFALTGLAATDTLDVVAVGAAPKDRLAVLAQPCVIYDSLASGDGALAPGTPRIIQASGALTGQGGASSCIPSIASAAIVTIAAINPQAPGNLRLSAADVVPAGGVVNYTNNGLNNSNTVTVTLSGSGAVAVAANLGATDARLVVIGFYAPGGRLTYFPLTPCAVADSRTGTGGFAGPFAAGANFPDVDVVGGFTAAQGGGNTDCGVPTGADGVVLNVVAVAPTGASGGLAVGKGGTEPTENTTNYAPIGLNNAAASYVAVNGESIALNITGGGSTHVRLVVLGYLDEGGTDHTTVTPCAAFDSRTDVPSDPNPPAAPFAGKRLAGAAGLTTYKVAGAIPLDQGGEATCGVPADARAVVINLVAIDPDAVGNFRVTGSGTTATGGVVNFAPLVPIANNSNAVVIPISLSGEIDLFVNAPSNNGLETVHARGVILGYFR